jgi:hypothetical protein
VGLTALLAKAPPWVMYAIGLVLLLAGAVETVDQVATGLVPMAMLKAAHVALAVGVFLGLASPGARKAAPLVLLVLSLGLSGCAGAKGFLVSGQTLDEAGAQFELAAPVVAHACEAKSLPVETCRGWRDFARKFQVLYRPSANAWHAAAVLNDAALERRYSDMVGPLLAEGADLYATLAKLGVKL